MEQEELENELLSVLDQLISRVVKISAQVRFIKEDPQQLYLVCLLGTIVEYSQALFLAARDERSAVSLPILVRTLLEAHVDLIILAQDQLHWKNMLCTFLSQRQRALRAAAANPYLASVAASTDYDAKLAEVEAGLQELRNDGHGAMSVRDRFKAAGLENEHGSIYWSLCQESHNNVSALEDRHIEHEDQTFRVVFFQRSSPARKSRLLHLAIAILLEGSKRVFSLIGASEVDSSLEESEARLASVSKEGLELMQSID